MQQFNLSNIIVAVALSSLATFATAEVTPHYGAPVNLDMAKKIAAGAAAEAKKNKWAMAIAVVDTHGMLIYYEMMDDTQTGSAVTSIEKARTAVLYRRPSKDFEQNVADGRLVVLTVPGATPIEGGIPIVIDGKVIGAVGVSGGASPQDAQCARAGLDTVK